MSHVITNACTGCTACVKVCPVDAITGARNSPHVINLEVCVDCGACGRICPVAAVLNEEGRVSQAVKRNMWLKPLVNAERCVSCGACIESCPTSVMEFAELVDHQVRAIAYLKDEKNCIGCSFCALACPIEAIQMRN